MTNERKINNTKTFNLKWLELTTRIIRQRVQKLARKWRKKEELLCINDAGKDVINVQLQTCCQKQVSYKDKDKFMFERES